MYGIGVMISMLGGNRKSVEAFNGAVGKVIADIVLKNNVLVFTFSDGAKLGLYDDGQSCCELRYFHSDDDLLYYVGATLMNAAVSDAPDVKGGDADVHEVNFLVVTTSKGAFTVCAHNVHNGYYGGFAIRAITLEPEGE